MPSEGSATGELMNAYPDGRVWWSRQVSFQISCPFAGLAFDTLPFDEQQCNFSMGMYGSTANEVYLRWRASDPANTPDAVGCADCSGYAVALENWQGPCLAEWHATELDQVVRERRRRGVGFAVLLRRLRLRLLLGRAVVARGRRLAGFGSPSGV